MPLYNPAGSGGGGISPPAGDIGGSAGTPTVVATHLTAALPVAQGGTASGSRNWAGLLTPTAVKVFSDSPYSAAAGQFIPIDTTSGNVVITLPNAPADLTVVAAKQVVQGGTNTVTINCAGSDVFNAAGGTTARTLTIASQAILLQYKASGAIWYVMADDLPLSGLDSRYVLTTAPQPSPATTGYVAWTGDRSTSPRYVATYNSAYPAGSVTLCRLNVPFGVTCTGNVDVMWNAGTGTAGSNGYLAMFDSTGAQIAVSADISGHAAGWITLATGKTSWAAGFYYCAFVIGTQFATTGCGPAAFGGELAVTTTAAPGDSQPYRTSHQIGGGLTAMPGSLTLGSGWVAWYMNMQFLLR